jgi:tetratricopeptide (TPR) repeat protein
MRSSRTQILGTLVIGMALLGGKAAFAQAQGSQQPATPAPAPANKDKAPAPVAPLTLDAAPPPVNAEEDAAMRAFREAPIADVAKKDQLGEDFVQKYPQSRYRAEVYSWLVRGYLNQGQIEKMEAAGDKELELEPNDPQTLAIVGSTLPRAMTSSMPEVEREKRLAKAEQYCKKALEILPTYAKPANMSDELFVAAKNQTAAMAYSGLGLVAFRRAKYEDAIPNLEQAIKLESSPDPVNFYLLGLCNEKASHFDDAVAAFTKCAVIPGGLQATCKTSIDEAKKLAATQLSVPK